MTRLILEGDPVEVEVACEDCIERESALMAGIAGANVPRGAVIHAVLSDPATCPCNGTGKRKQRVRVRCEVRPEPLVNTEQEYVIYEPVPNPQGFDMMPEGMLLQAILQLYRDGEDVGDLIEIREASDE